jgi:hypothetical protein
MSLQSVHKANLHLTSHLFHIAFILTKQIWDLRTQYVSYVRPIQNQQLKL